MTKFFGLISAVPNDVGWINTNSDGIPDTQRVYAVRIWDVASPRENNNTFGISATSKPNKLSLINIYVDKITTFQRTLYANYTLRQFVNHTIGHEVGHTVNLEHCPKKCWDNTSSCMMRPSPKGNIGASPSSYHYIDYDLADSVRPRQYAYTPPKQENTRPETAIAPSLSPASGVYTATAGTATRLTSLPVRLIVRSIGM